MDNKGNLRILGVGGLRYVSRQRYSSGNCNDNRADRFLAFSGTFTGAEGKRERLLEYCGAYHLLGFMFFFCGLCCRGVSSFSLVHLGYYF